MTRPTQAQVDDAVAMIKEHFKVHRGTAVDNRVQALVYSIYSVMTGDGKPAEEFDAVLAEQRDARLAAAETAVEETADDIDDDDDDPDEYTEEELAAMSEEELLEIAAEGDIDIPDGYDKDMLIAAIMAA